MWLLFENNFPRWALFPSDELHFNLFISLKYWCFSCIPFSKNEFFIFWERPAAEMQYLSEINRLDILPHSLWNLFCDFNFSNLWLTSCHLLFQTYILKACNAFFAMVMVLAVIFFLIYGVLMYFKASVTMVTVLAVIFFLIYGVLMYYKVSWFTCHH